jgi:uncharacterized protein (DUF924 family)
MEQMFFAKFPVLVDGKKITWGKAINMKWFDKAAKGDMRAIQEFNDRFLGKAKQEIDAHIQQSQQEEIVVRFEGPTRKEGE